MNIKDIKGIIPPIVTPVDKRECVDVEGLKRVVTHVLEGGVHGVFVMGSNSEFYGMDESEQKKAVEVVVEKVDGRVPVYAGATAITTKKGIALAKTPEKVGADALSIMTPMFINPNDEEMYQHFKAIARETKLPILLYNNPGKTTNNISVKLLCRLAEIDNIVGIKNTTLDFAQTINYIHGTRHMKNFTVLAGSDYYIYATLAYGGGGAVAGTANVAPRLVTDIYEKYIAGDAIGAMKAQMELVPLRNTYSLGTFPVVMKECMNLMGLNVGEPIRPVGGCGAQEIEVLRELLRTMKLI